MHQDTFDITAQAPVALRVGPPDQVYGRCHTVEFLFAAAGNFDVIHRATNIEETEHEAIGTPQPVCLHCSV